LIDEDNAHYMGERERKFNGESDTADDAVAADLLPAMRASLASVHRTTTRLCRFLQLVSGLPFQTLGRIDRRLDHRFVFLDPVNIEVRLIDRDIVRAVEPGTGFPLVPLAHLQPCSHQFLVTS
jgi:hypothetical protein